MDKFEFVENGKPYKVTKGGNYYQVFDWTGWSCTYPIDNSPTNWINKMIEKHLKEPAPNGVDAQGNPIYFDVQKDLKSWMRVVLVNGSTYIVAEDKEKKFLVNQGWLNTNHEDGWEILQVFEAPTYETDYLCCNDKGSLIWKRTPPKSAEQLAQEAAVAARKAAIEEAEKALKTAQEKLDMLKGM